MNIWTLKSSVKPGPAIAGILPGLLPGLLLSGGTLGLALGRAAVASEVTPPAIVETGDRAAADGFSYRVGGCADKRCTPKGKPTEADAPAADPLPPQPGTGDLTVVEPRFGFYDASLAADGDSIVFEYARSSNCCYSLTLDHQREGQTIDIIETAAGAPCRCLCSFDLTGRIEGLVPGTYRVRFFQRSRRGEQNLVADGTVDVTNAVRSAP